ncbi:MAG: SCO family protein [Candidatus Zixiibacteriota bacterium]
MRRFIRYILVLAVVNWIGVSSLAQVINQNDPALEGIDIEEHLGDIIPLDVVLTNDAGKQVILEKYFNDDKLVILILGYYTCPMLCNLVFNGVTEGIRNLAWTPGKEYRLLTVSIDPLETVQLAADKKQNYIKSLGRAEVSAGWTYFVAAAEESKRLADAIGFKYYWDEANNQYAHAAVITILTPEGKISRYLYGIEFKERDLRLALLEASEGKIGNTIDRVLLYCFHYDPDAGGYVVLAGNVMKLGGTITVVLLVLFLGFWWLRESRRRRVSTGQNKI